MIKKCEGLKFIKDYVCEDVDGNIVASVRLEFDDITILLNCLLDIVEALGEEW